MAKGMHRKDLAITRRPKQTNKSNYMVVAMLIIITLCIIIGILYALKATTSKNVIVALSSADTTPYNQTRLTKIPIDKSFEYNRDLDSGKLSEEEVAEIKHKKALLIKMQYIWEVIPWEIKYKQIQEQEISRNSALASYRLDLIQKYDPILSKLNYAINNPNDDSYDELVNAIYNADQDILNSINEAEQRSAEFGAKNSMIIIESLKKLRSLSRH